MEKYIATIDKEFVNPEIDAGIKRASIVVNPAIRMKGYAFQLETKLVHFADEKKMRIASPILIPMEVYRKKDEDEAEHTITFTEKELDAIFSDMMQDFSNKDFINVEHSDEIAPAFLREVWQVEDPKKDKSYLEYGIEVPKGSIFGVLQFTDEAFYDKCVKEGRTGISIEGYFGRKLVEMADQSNHADTIIFNDANEVLFLKRSKDSEFEPSKWGFVGGKIDAGEKPKEAGARELEEETGIKTEIEEVGMAELKDGSNTFYYTAKIDNPTVTISDEHDEFEFVPIEKIKDLEVIKGENEAFDFIAKEALKKVEQKTNLKMNLPDGEYKDADGKTFVIKDGKVVEPKAEEMEETEEVKAETEEKKEEELADETEVKEGDENKAEEKKEELEGEPAPATEPANTYTKEEVDAMFEEVYKVFGELKAEVTGKTDEETEEEVIEQLSAHDQRLQKVLKLTSHMGV